MISFNFRTVFGEFNMGRKRDHNGELVKVIWSGKLRTEKRQELARKKTKPSVKFTDLNDKCIMYILGLLQLDTLSHVAHVNLRFNKLVTSYIKNKCEKSKVSIVTSNRAQCLWIDGIVGKFIFNDISDLTKFFHKSNHLITCLSISCSTYSLYQTYRQVEKSIFEDCSEMLTELKLQSNLLPVLSDVTKVFHNVVELNLNGCELSENLSRHFINYFPSIRRLALIDCKTHDPTCIETHFESLVDLTLVGKRKNRNVFKKANIKVALQLNPQIRCLLIDFNSTNDRELHTKHPDYELDTDFYRFVSEAMPKLKQFTVYGELKHQTEDKYSQINDDIEFLHMQQLTVQYIYSREPYEIVPFKFHRLRELKLEHMTMLSGEWLKFIIRNDYLEKLTVNICCSYENDEDTPPTYTQIVKEQLLTIVEWLTKLKELHLSAATVDATDIMAILSKRKSLMRIYLSDYNEIDSIINTFDKLTAKKKWLVDYDENYLILKRFAT